MARAATAEGKQPYYFALYDNPVMTIAGIQDAWNGQPGGSKAPDDDPTLIERSDGAVDNAALAVMIHAVGRKIGNI